MAVALDNLCRCVDVCMKEKKESPQVFPGFLKLLAVLTHLPFISP